MKNFGLLCCCLFSGATFAESLNVLLYHHISDQTPKVTSTTLQDFQAQLDYIDEQGYQVVDLEKAVLDIKNGTSLPKQSIALTFDDGFISVCETAYPELKKRGLPFTVFVTTDPIDKNFGQYCSWEQLKEMADNGVTIANHTQDHAHLVSEALSNEQWLEQATHNINQAQNKLTAKLGHAPMLFAYPYGEYNNQLKQWLAKKGYIAFGQQSGSIDSVSDWQALPRFNAAGNYASVKALKFKFNASPLPLDYVHLPDPLTKQKQPNLVVKLLPSQEAHYPHLQCFYNGQPIKIDWRNEMEFSVRPPKELGQGRHRINCTAPHRNGSPFFWLSQQWQVIQ